MVERDGHLEPGCDYPRAGSIEIRVQDDGVGMTKDQLTKLFGEGVQFDADKLQHGGGSGLGLHIARGMVLQHNGTIRAESDGIGKGSTFIMELPLYAFPALKSSDRYGDRSFGQTESSFSDMSEHGRRILVVEDAASSRKMLIRLLERAGHTCVPAANGLEAVQIMAQDMKKKKDADHQPIDTILIDFEMPLLNGPRATRRIREELGFKGEILGVTGNVMPNPLAWNDCGIIGITAHH